MNRVNIQMVNGRGKGEPGSVRLGKTRILYYVVMNEGAAFVLFFNRLHCKGAALSGAYCFR